MGGGCNVGNVSRCGLCPDLHHLQGMIAMPSTAPTTGCDLSRNVFCRYTGILLLPANRTNRLVGGLRNVIKMLLFPGEIVRHGHLSVGAMLLTGFV
jgi:hypothetical protein